MAAGVVNQEVYGPVRVETATGQALEQKLPQAFLALLVGLYRVLVPGSLKVASKLWAACPASVRMVMGAQ